jgi:hypothetical protein
MIIKHAVLLAGLMACLASVSSFAAQLGDPAPPLTVQEWIKGQPVDVKAGTNIYVLVFCALSRANDFALTSLTELQKMYRDKGVVVAAISDGTADQLRDYVQIKGAKIGFSVAIDDVDRTKMTYQRAFEQVAQTRAYVVGKDGNVLWHGHPLTDGLGEVVDEIVSGRYDMKQTQKRIIAAEMMEKYLELARTGDTNSLQVGRIIMRYRFNDAAGLCDLASTIATDTSIVYPDFALANTALDRAEQLGATNTTDIAVDRAILLFQNGKEAEGLARAKRALADAPGQVEKDEAQTCVHAMEVRMTAEKASPNTNQSTNQSTSQNINQNTTPTGSASTGSALLIVWMSAVVLLVGLAVLVVKKKIIQIKALPQAGKP